MACYECNGISKQVETEYPVNTFWNASHSHVFQNTVTFTTIRFKFPLQLTIIYSVQIAVSNLKRLNS